MDKNSNRISIKINGEEHNLNEEPKDSGVIPNNVIPLIKDKSSNHEQKVINLASDDEDKLDSEERYDNKEIAAAQESEDDFTWVLPHEDDSNRLKTYEIHEIEDVREKVPNSFNYKKKARTKGVKRNHNYTIKHLLTSILLAIVVGLGFGAIILNLMDMGEEQATSVPTVTTGTNNPPASTDKEEKTEAPTTSLELAALNTAVVQEGKYSSADSAKTVVESVKNSGLPATAIETDGAYFVYVGIGVEKTELEQIETAFIDKMSKEPWSKPFTIEGGSYEKVNEKDRDYIQEAQKLFTLLMGQSSTAFESKSIPGEQWTSITEQVEKLGKSEGLSEGLKSYSTSLTSAYEHLKSFKDSKDEATLWKSQQSLLDTLYHYQNWKGSLS